MASLGFALLATGACLLLMQAAARIGFSKLLARYAVATNSLPAADQAVRLTPSDPDAHHARATVLNRLRRPAEAKASLETATSLRTRDDYLWLELGNTREELGDNDGALAAFDQAVRCAPHYGHTRWQRGNLLLRMGRYDEAFADLRQAAASNRKFFPNLIDLAWGLSRDDVKATEALLQPRTDDDRLAFARFLAQRGKGTDVAGQIRLLAAPLSVENKDELVGLLFASKAFREAFALRQGTHARAEFLNAGFEESLVFSNAAFGWIISPGQAKVKLAVDVSERFSGAKSLQISFDGEWPASTPLLSQTIVVEPQQGYRITFAVKTKDLTTGAPPRMFVRDAVSDQVLGESAPLSEASGTSWQKMTVEFTTLAASEAIVIRLDRASCSATPCPIFGVVWLDEFAIEKL